MFLALTRSASLPNVAASMNEQTAGGRALDHTTSKRINSQSDLRDVVAKRRRLEVMIEQPEVVPEQPEVEPEMLIDEPEIVVDVGPVEDIQDNLQMVEDIQDDLQMEVQEEQDQPGQVVLEPAEPLPADAIPVNPAVVPVAVQFESVPPLVMPILMPAPTEDVNENLASMVSFKLDDLLFTDSLN